MIEFLLFLHILLFVFSFAFTAGIGILNDRVARTRDARTIHAVFRAAQPLSMLGGIGWMLTAAAGVALAMPMAMTSPPPGFSVPMRPSRC